MKTITLSTLIFAAALAQQRDTTRQQELGRPIHEGLIEPYRSVQLSPAVDGVLEEVRVDRGDMVVRNQVLARLESSVELATLDIAKARAELVGELRARKASLGFTRRKAESDENLLIKGIVSNLEADQSHTEKLLAEAGLLQTEEAVKLSELELTRANAALALRTIKSPITGVVVDRLLSPGELVTRQVQSVIFELAQIHPLNVEVILPVSLFGSIKVGDEAEVDPRGPVSGTYPAKVSVVDRVVDAASGTFRVRLELPNPDYRLPAGIRCSVNFSQVQ